MSVLSPLLWCLLTLLLVNIQAVHARSVERSLLADGEVIADPTVLILGGGVAGVIAARTLYEQGITNFVIVEARGACTLSLVKVHNAHPMFYRRAWRSPTDRDHRRSRQPVGRRAWSELGTRDSDRGWA